MGLPLRELQACSLAGTVYAMSVMKLLTLYAYSEQVKRLMLQQLLGEVMIARAFDARGSV